MQINSLQAQQSLLTTLTKNSGAANIQDFASVFSKEIGAAKTAADLTKADPYTKFFEIADAKIRPSIARPAIRTSAVTSADQLPRIYQKIIDQMMHKANQSANQMSDEGRKRVAKEFEILSEKLADALEKSGLFHEDVMPIVRSYIASLDISTKANANKTFNEMYNLDRYVSQLDGSYEDPPPPGFKHIETLRQLQHMANRAANYMTDEQRKELNEQFHTAMDQFLDQLEESGVIEYDVVMNFMRDYLSGLDIANREDAQRAFNELYNLESYLETLV